ncbi:HlyD family secretion protein [Tunturiibacter empetritectus]|uniref:Membrane fusion protein (Multidrug efflux system) n=1 Tax=Tunturiibacter lichenicola TaxID=2051959 RepID=A0A852VGZ4_9BACT|nr:HlyD family secretion protein [Edaphobacter lichenicola]NYF88746.1 membrane fusion protein (multidrug efflux system) [Edaphobacter lichenicola]
MPTQIEDDKSQASISLGDFEQNGEESKEQKATKEQKAPFDPGKHRRNIILGVVVVAILLIGSIVWWLYSGTYESTDDAQVDGHLNPIAARVDGTIRAVYIEDNQTVHAGQPLLDLDTKDAEVSVAQAQADYDQALEQRSAETPNLPIQQVSNETDVANADSEVVNAEAALAGAQHDYDSDVAKLHQAEATNEKAQSDLHRYKQLVEKRELAQSDYDQYLASAKSDAANVDASAAAAASQGKLIDQRRAQLKEQEAKRTQTLRNAPRQVAIKNADNRMREASLESYGAKLEQAKLNLTYCHVVAPVDGIVLQRSAEVGGRITGGQQLLMIAQIDHPWIVANFKETQLHKMHPGQRVDIKVDALSKSFIGEVEAMAATTGDRASTLPAENATGNYVKVIQRLPVRIRFKDGQDGLDELRAGMSVEPKVHIE